MKISIITVNYNDAVGLEKTIRSVVSQSYQDKEYIVIDGNSSDGSVEIICKYSNYISKWVSEPDSGIYNAMNKGIRMATGDYCIMMNAGDVFFSSKVLSEVSRVINGGKDVYNGNAFYVNGKGAIDWYRKGHKDVSLRHFYRSSICHQATFIKTSLLKNYLYDETLRMVSDWKFWIQAICLGGASYQAMDIDICCFNTEGVTTTQSELGRREREQVLEELLPPETLDKCRKTSSLGKFEYLRKGLKRRFWLYYARIFKTNQVRRVI